MLDKRDFSLALALHMLVVMGLFAVNQWRMVVPEDMPKRTIQVNIVSLQALQAMIPKPKEVKNIEPEKKTTSPPKIQPQAKPEPIKKVKQPAPVKKTVVKKQIVQPKVEEELDYDPFAPLESTKKKPRKKKISGKEVLDDMLKQQLSDEALAVYITGMQQAVERKWKVPTEMIGRVNDALVELHLFKNGKVKKVMILQSSGSQILDASLIQAIYAAAPFAVPEQQFELFKVNTIRFFPLK